MLYTNPLFLDFKNANVRGMALTDFVMGRMDDIDQALDPDSPYFDPTLLDMYESGSMDGDPTTFGCE